MVAQARQAREELAEKSRAQADLLQMLEQDLKEVRDGHERLVSEAGRHFDALEKFRLPSPPVPLEAVLAAVRDLLAATLPKQVFNRLTEEACRMGVRAAAFEIRGKVAWAASADGFEPPLTEKALRSLVVPLTVNSPFREVFETGRQFGGNSGGLKKNANVLNRLKPDTRDSILLLPIRSADAVSAVLYADSGGSGASLPEDALALLAEFAGARLDRLMVMGGRARTAVKKDIARGAQPESTSSLESPAAAAVEPPTEAAERGEAYALQGETSASSQQEPPPTPPAPPVVEAATPIVAPLAEAPAELPAESVGGASPPSQEEPPPSPPAPPVIEATTPIVAAPGEALAELPAESVGEASPPSQQEPLPSPPTPPVIEAATPIVAAPGEAPAELPAESVGEASTPSQEEPPPPPPAPPVIGAAAPIVAPPGEAVAEPPAAPAPIDFAPASEPVPAPVVEAPAEVGGTLAPAPGVEGGDAQGSEAEEKLRKDARRLAKLLVFEIELYHKTEAAEGRKSKDLYKRLKRDIELSRQTFDRRFGETVGKQFDYIHDELVRTLAGDDPSLLGSDYPGPSA